MIKNSRKFLHKNIFDKQILFAANHMSLREQLMFTRDLALMSSSGILLIEAVGVLQHQYKGKQLSTIFRDIAEQLSYGVSFGRALRRHPKSFNIFFINMIEVGELTGELPEMLHRIHHYLDRSYSIRQKILQASSYPMVVIAISFVAIVILMQFIVPTFAELFQTAGRDLPISTKILLSVSFFLQEHIFIIAGSIVLAIYAVRIALHMKIFRACFG